MDEPVVIEGKIDIGSIEAMDYESLRRWIDRRLHGEDYAVPRDFKQGVLGYSRISQLYLKLSPNKQAIIDAIVADFIREMSLPENTRWRDDAAHELLLLAQSIYVSSKPKTNESMLYILAMIEDRRFFDPDIIDDSRDIHFRLLQSLIGMKWRGDIEFWKDQVALAPDRYLRVAFMGAALISPKHAIELLPEVQWNDRTEDQIRRVLPYFIQSYGSVCLMPLFTDVLGRLGTNASVALRRQLASEGLDIPVPASPRSYEEHKRVLSDLNCILISVPSRLVSQRADRAAYL